MDLSKLVSGGGKLKGAFGDLAYKIGESLQLQLTGMTDLRSVAISAFLQPYPR